MSALAGYLCQKGGAVSGSDREESMTLDRLKKCCNVYVGERPQFVDGVDMVVYSSAVNPRNTELERAISLGIPTYERRQFLAMVADDFSRTVAVGGTHGKTTVSAMIIHVLKTLNANFSAHVGGETEYGNFVCNGNDLFVTEACEYKCSLLDLNPYMSVVLNAELDHPDCYENLEDLYKVFLTFLSKARVKVFPADFDICKYGHICTKDNEKTLWQDACRYASKNPDKKGEKSVIVLSNDKVDIWTEEYMGDGKDTHGQHHSQMVVFKNGHRCMETCLYDNSPNTPFNTLVVIAVLDHFGIGAEEVSKSLLTFKGVKRRNEAVGRLSGARVVFDYAHHPTQIDGMLSTYEGKNLVVFQPHTYSRTRAYFDDFVLSLSKADTLIVMDTYGAREVEADGISSEVLAKAVATKSVKTKVYHAKTDNEVVDLVKTLCYGHDNLLFLGAGDIYSLKEQLDLDRQTAPI